MASYCLKTVATSTSGNVLLLLHQTNAVFGKARCKICGDSVRLVLKHLNDKHPEIMVGNKSRESMDRLVKKYFEDA